MKTILIVDDSESIREVVGLNLETAGFHVLKGESGTHALSLLTGIPVDLLITDLYMPEMDGIEFIKLVRKIDMYRFMPILFLTTESQLAKKQQAQEAGASGWIVKPFIPEKLMQVVKRMIR